jgi:hypothetical protein
MPVPKYSYYVPPRLTRGGPVPFQSPYWAGQYARAMQGSSPGGAQELLYPTPGDWSGQGLFRGQYIGPPGRGYVDPRRALMNRHWNAWENQGRPAARYQPRVLPGQVPGGPYQRPMQAPAGVQQWRPNIPPAVAPTPMPQPTQAPWQMLFNNMRRALPQPFYGQPRQLRGR